MDIPDWSKYGATKSITSSLSDVMVSGAITISVSWKHICPTLYMKSWSSGL